MRKFIAVIVTLMGLIGIVSGIVILAGLPTLHDYLGIALMLTLITCYTIVLYYGVKEFIHLKG
jgi:hypothetical protein